jgi:DNA relaxase NicK
LRARLTRVDLAGDDFDGSILSIAWGLAQREARGFVGQGRPPKCTLITNFDGEGDTLYVGKRENGRMLRLYEKGKQLGDAMSRWCRAEVEYRAKDRVLEFSMLLRPAEYLAGAFPCLSFFAEVACRVRAFRDRAKLSYARVVANARLHAGRAINAVLHVTGGDVGACLSLLRRSGLPARLDAASMRALTSA